VRGDSLRDLYAKALALLGLGALALVGALVDYWPTRVPFPAVSEASFVGADGGLQAIPPGALAGMAPATRHGALVQLASVRTPVAADAPPESTRPRLVLAAHRMDPVAIPAVRLTRPVEAADAEDGVDDVDALALAAAYDPDGVEVTIEPPDVVLASTRTSLTAGVDAGEDDGLFTGAFKRTGTSIVRTGVKTGASIFDALRVVSGAVRRALPD
jgi:hypothetical protein